MRKIIVITMITLDGVMQAPGGPDEDTEGGFAYGGWAAPYGDEVFNETMAQEMQPAHYLLGAKTFAIWQDYWPNHADVWPGINDGIKYVMTDKETETEWKNTKFISSVEDINKLKQTDGPNLQVWGSGKLVQTLLTNDLVDELRIKTFPLTLGQGKKLFAKGTIPAAFTLTESSVTPSGVIFANYKRAGAVKTGTVGA